VSEIGLDTGSLLAGEQGDFRRFLDSLPFVVWLTDEAGRCTFANATALELLGKANQEVFASGWAGFVHPDDFEPFTRQLRELSGSAPGREIELRMRDHSGEYRWFLSTLVPTTDRLGQRTGYAAYAADITGAKQAADFLYRSETRYRQLFDSNLIGAAYTSINGAILDANDHFLKTIGYSAEDLRSGSLRWMDITPPEYKAQAEMNLSELRATRVFKPIEKEYIRRDGSRVPVLVTSGLLEGSTTECVTFVVDLTERKRAEQALRKHAETLAKGQVSALNRTLALLATEPSLDTVLCHVLKAITEQLNVTSSGLHLMNIERNSLFLRMHYREGRISSGADLHHPSETHPRYVVHVTERWQKQEGEDRRPAVFDVTTSEELDESERSRLLVDGINTLLLVPLMVHRNLVGTLSIQLQERRSLLPGEIELAQALAQQASLAVHLTHLGERSRRVAVLEERNLAATDRAAELARANQALKQTLDLLAAEPDMNEVLGHVLTVITQVLEGSVSTLWLRDQDSETVKLHLVYRNGSLVNGKESGHRLAGQTLSLTRQDIFALAVFRKGRPVWHEVETSKALDEAARKYLGEQGVKSLLGIPLILGNKTIGSIVVRFPKVRQFGFVELEVAQGLAQQATLALQLTRLAEHGRKAAITEERNRMAREIHDTLAQGFLGVLIQLQAAKQVLDGASPDASRHLESAMSLARDGLAEARRSVQGLRPQLLRDGNIATALDRLVRQLSSESVLRIDFSTTGGTPTLSPDVETNLLRISQEAITNAMKHSSGNEISVRLAVEPDALQLTIEDNGAGFDPHVSTLSRGFGLISMQERADRIGGDLTILTQPGAGTKVLVVVPLTHSGKAGAAHA
jgi:PAS domain S-box-containing protein